MKIRDEFYNSKVGLVLPVLIAIISLEIPVEFLSVFLLLICLSLFLLLKGIVTQQSEVRKGFMFSGFPDSSLISKWGVVHGLLIICFIKTVRVLGFSFEPLWWFVAALSMFAGIRAGVIKAGKKVSTAFDFEEGLVQLLRISPGFDFGIFLLSGMTCCCMGAYVVRCLLVVLPACFLLTGFIWNPAKQVGLEPFSNMLTPNGVIKHRPKVRMSGLMCFLSTGAEISLRTRASRCLAGYQGVGPMPAGLFSGSYFRFMQESLPNFI